MLIVSLFDIGGIGVSLFCIGVLTVSLFDIGGDGVSLFRIWSVNCIVV